MDKARKRGCEGWREGSAPPPGLSHDAAIRAGREPIGLWPLMLWAYNEEMVRFSCGTDFRPAAVSQSTLEWAMKALAAGGVVEGSDECGYDFAACAHEDALGLHGHVLRVIDRQARGTPRREAFELLILQTEIGAPPPWHLPEPHWTVRPVLRKKGKVQHLYGKRHEPLACVVECVGQVEGFAGTVSSMEEWRALRERCRDRYRRWCALLGEVLHSMGPQQMCLSRWRVSEIGVALSPWSTMALKAA